MTKYFTEFFLNKLENECINILKKCKRPVHKYSCHMIGSDFERKSVRTTIEDYLSSGVKITSVTWLENKLPIDKNTRKFL